MATNIEWCDETWNPMRGCTHVSPGCANCYAEAMAGRFTAAHLPYHDLAERRHGRWRWSGRLKLVGHRLDKPHHWRKPRRVFVNSMSDLFHEDAPDAWIQAIFDTFVQVPRHTYLVLTKRAARMRLFLKAEASVLALGDRSFEDVYDHVWWGVSVEDQKRADERLPELAETRGRVRWASIEPLLGAIDLSDYLSFLDWIVVGGETGHHARPADKWWVQDLVHQAAEAGVPVFFKKWGTVPEGQIESLVDGLEVRSFPLTPSLARRT